MLENISIVIGYCDSHSVCSFFIDFFIGLNVLGSKLNITAFNLKSFTVYECIRKFYSCSFINSCHGCSCNIHPL